MKKTMSILAAAALSLGAATSYAKEITLKPYADYMEPPSISEVLAPGATLINSETGKVVVYNINGNSNVEPPFDITLGQIVWNLELANKNNEPITLMDVAKTASDSAIRIKDGDTLVLDFTSSSLKLDGPTEAEYMVLMFHTQEDSGDNFAEWYSTNECSITGRFTNGDYIAYAIDDTSDLLSSGHSSTYGGLVFFNKAVIDNVNRAEVDPGTIIPDPEGPPAVPEPTTATLSLLALAGLVARRRRR